MTEAEWQGNPVLGNMLVDLVARSIASDRKLRLFCCACYRSVGLESALVRVAEQYADGKAKAVALRNEAAREKELTWHTSRTLAATGECLSTRIGFISADADRTALATVPYGETTVDNDRFHLERQKQIQLLRDIFGNPFRPPTADPAWRTSTVTALATGIYQERAFDRLPILADALQDAGCENEDLLNHCRQPGEHVRGCWVVDLVLGKE